MVFNNELELEFPKGFRVMDAQERKGLNLLADGPGEILTDPDRHIIVSVGWKTLGGLTAKLVSAKDAAENAESAVRKPMQAFGYALAAFDSRALGGEKAEGFRYSYTVKAAAAAGETGSAGQPAGEDVGMLGETYTMKRGKTLYYLHFYGRQALKEDSLAVWNGILASAHFVQGAW